MLCRFSVIYWATYLPGDDIPMNTDISQSTHGVRQNDRKKKRLEDARRIIMALGLPKAQQNERKSPAVPANLAGLSVPLSRCLPLDWLRAASWRTPAIPATNGAALTREGNVVKPDNANDIAILCLPESALFPGVKVSVASPNDWGSTPSAFGRPLRDTAQAPRPASARNKTTIIP